MVLINYKFQMNIDLRHADRAMVEAFNGRGAAEWEPFSTHNKSRGFVLDTVAEGGNFRHIFLFFPANPKCSTHILSSVIDSV
jgi:hypothetical protein